MSAECKLWARWTLTRCNFWSAQEMPSQLRSKRLRSSGKPGSKERTRPYSQHWHLSKLLFRVRQHICSQAIKIELRSINVVPRASLTRSTPLSVKTATRNLKKRRRWRLKSLNWLAWLNRTRHKAEKWWVIQLLQWSGQPHQWLSQARDEASKSLRQDQTHLCKTNWIRITMGEVRVNKSMLECPKLTATANRYRWSKSQFLTRVT